MIARTAAATTAARLLYLKFNDAIRNSRPLPEQSATHFWNPVHGEGSVIIGTDGSYLCADSSIPLDQHLVAFAAGRRSAVA
jgi:hypothetical protein